MPDDVRGRIFALDFGIDMTTVSISALILGALAQTVAIRPLLLGLGIVAIVFGLAWAVLTRPLWSGLDAAADEGWRLAIRADQTGLPAFSLRVRNSVAPVKLSIRTARGRWVGSRPMFGQQTNGCARLKWRVE